MWKWRNVLQVYKRMAWLVEALQTKHHSWDDPKCEFYLARKHTCRTRSSSPDWLRKFVPKFSPFIWEIIPQLHHQVASVFSLFASFYLCSHMFPGRKIKSSTNHFRSPRPRQIDHFSVLLKFPYTRGLENWFASKTRPLVSHGRKSVRGMSCVQVTVVSI